MNMNDPVDVLARTIDGENEAGGEQGMTSIANVVCTRASHGGWWGSSILEVCLAPEQFDCWLPGPDRDRIVALTPDNPNFVLALRIAGNAVMNRLADITYGADSYYAPASVKQPPEWAEKAIFTCEIAGQRFYRTV
jgi:N-acetylmuramoyl-L-alanine amidase